MQKHLELENEYRRMQEENNRILLEKKELEEKEKETKKERDYYIQLARKERKEKEFYAEQLSGDGITRNEMKNCAELAIRLKEDSEKEYRALRSSNRSLSENCRKYKEKIADLEEKNGTLEKENEKLRNSSKITPQEVNHIKNMEYILYGLENGCPDAQNIKDGMLTARKLGKKLMERESWKEK